MVMVLLVASLKVVVGAEELGGRGFDSRSLHDHNSHLNENKQQLEAAMEISLLQQRPEAEENKTVISRNLSSTFLQILFKASIVRIRRLKMKIFRSHEVDSDGLLGA